GGLGPTLVAVLTDYLFRDDNALKYSLVIVGSAAHLMSGVLLWIGLKYFRGSLQRMQAWTAGQATTDGATSAPALSIHGR
ncbi:MAG: hypothetical protein ACRDQZ_24110, partial [Mycobacteriales bacterium]